MLVTRITGKCPGCGIENAYGNVSVRDDHVLRGCLRCTHEEEIWLPPIRKKVLYLDQFFLSNAFKERDVRFRSAAQLIEEKAKRQLLLTPYSSTHEDETYQWRGYAGKSRDDLMEFIKAASGGHEFKPKYKIETDQIAKAFSAFLEGRPADYAAEENEAFRRNPHRWEDYFRIDVPGYFKDIELVRKIKGEITQGLLDAFDSWRVASTTFDEDLAIEFREAANIYIKAHLTRVDRLSKGDFSAVIDSPIVSTVVEDLQSFFSSEVPLTVRAMRVSEFFQSQHFRNVPYQRISCYFFALLKGMVKRGAYKNREKAERKISGLTHDLEHVAAYAPYCDAFVMDQAMAEIMSSPTLNLQGIYNVKIFSLNNWDEMLSWLQDLDREITVEHRDGLRSAYGIA